MRTHLGVPIVTGLALTGALACSSAPSDAEQSGHPADDAKPVVENQEAARPREVSREELIALFEEGTSSQAVVLLDVRSAGEFEKGHIPGAVHIPHDELGGRLTELAAHRDHEIVLYCHSGRRAGIAADLLVAAGFEKLAHLDGDMAGWVENGFPVER